MRVIAGQWKGRPLAAFKADNIRPTTDRIKEVLFNMIQFEIQDARVLDLFSGTGNLAIEALSRGAQQVVAVENHRKSLAVINKNKSQFSIDSELKVYPQDVLRFLKIHAEVYDVILIDPPFTKKMADLVMQELAQSKVIRPGTIIFIESTKHEKIADSYSSIRLTQQKSFGDKFLSYFTVEE